ncbi:MAG: hypothetical protein QF662_02600 [Phycisphaerae bacterium]|nr:hypothetical protein [Phycisphaerae bacterium]
MDKFRGDAQGAMTAKGRVHSQTPLVLRTPTSKSSGPPTKVYAPRRAGVPLQSAVEAAVPVRGGIPIPPRI